MDIGRARERVSQLLGTAIADKVTDAWAVAFVDPAPSREAGISLPRTIIELVPQRDEAAMKGVTPEGRSSQIESLKRESWSRAQRLASDSGQPCDQDFLEDDFCWLNECIRWRGQHRALAEIACSEDIAQIDLPHRVRRELATTTTAIHADSFRESTGLTGRGAIVAVIDGEVDARDPAVSDRLEHMANLSQEPWGAPDEHGTAVATVIGGCHGQIQGVAPRANLWSYKVFPTSDRFSDDFDAAKAITQALEDGAHIANCSWGTGFIEPGSVSREARACNDAWALGMAIVKSAGNFGSRRGGLTRPAEAKGILVVGATDSQGRRVADYSSRGTLEDGRRIPHLVAPGGTDDMPVVLPGVRASGTSLAAPHVSGAAALLHEEEPDRLAEDLREELLSLCHPLPNTAPEAQGAGMLILRRGADRSA